LYRTWDTIGTTDVLSPDVTCFIKHSLSLDPQPPAAIVADCLLMIGLVLGIGIHVDDLSVVDKSQEVSPQITRIFERLAEILQRPQTTGYEIDRALQVMELLAPFPDSQTSRQSYGLFRVIMDTPISLTFTSKKKWTAARLMMDGAYNWDKYLPWVKDPSHILAFLNHHFDLITKSDENWEGPILSSLRAFAYASGPETRDALVKFDPTQSLFVRGMCYAYEGERPFQVRKAALFFLPLIGDKWFNAPEPFMDADQMRKFCMNWASFLDIIEPTHDVQKAALATLFGMINSPQWRPHIVPNRWRLLQYFTIVPDDSRPLRHCLDNPGLMDAIRDVDEPSAMVLWLAVLWLKYGELIPVVREQLEAATRELVQGARRTDLDMYLSLVESELKKAEEKMKEQTWSTDVDAVEFWKKIDCLKQSREMLSAIKELPSYANAVAGPSGAP